MKLRMIPLICLVPLMFAQAPDHPRMHGMAAGKTNAIQSYLNLTDAQISSLRQLRQSEREALKSIFDQMGGLHESLRSSDAATVEKAQASMKALEQQAAPIRASFQQQAQAVLTPEQKTKLAALQSAAALFPAVHEAGALNLLTPPEGPGGGPGRFGPRP